MKIKEIREKDSDALKRELKDQQKHLFDLRTQSVTEKLEDPTQMGKTRRTIARIKTVLRQHESAQNESAQNESAQKEPAAT